MRTYMKPKILFISLLLPGLGYLQMGDRRGFFRTILLFFGVLIAGAASRAFSSFGGLMAIVFSLAFLYIFPAFHVSRMARRAGTTGNVMGRLKFCLTFVFFLIVGVSFAGRRRVLGFDIMRMEVPVMQPSLMPGERFLVDTWAASHGLGRGMVVVHAFKGQKGLYLNRIIAVGGDKIEIKNGTLLINGSAVQEPYVLAANATKPLSKNMPAIVVAPGRYFVMGDNRDASLGDSRFNGTIAAEDVAGRATAILTSKDGGRVGSFLK